MRMRSFIVGILLLMGGLSAQAQCGSENNAIKAGETLSYELKFNWKFIWINAGWANMTVTDTNYQGQSCLRTELQSYTNRKIDRFFKMRDTLVSIVTQRLEPLYFRKAAEEGKHYTIDEVRFGYKSGKCIVDQQRSVDLEEPRRQYDEASVCVYDMLSILLQARSYDPTNYKPGLKILFSMATGKKIEKETLIYRGKKDYKAENGVKYRCLVFSLVEYDDKRKEKEVITFYVTDDKNHLPVRLDLYLNFGSAKAFLKDVKGNRHPLTSIVED